MLAMKISLRKMHEMSQDMLKAIVAKAEATNR